jgi:hypothetical protein
VKKGEPSAFNGTVRFAGVTIDLKSILGKPMGFVLLAFVIGATISQGSFAFADDSATNPFRAIWEAIGELQVKTDSLQAQIDDLKSQQGITTTVAQTITKTSDGSVAIEIGGGDSGQTIITLITHNAGPDNSVGTKLTVFYQRSLLQLNFVEGADCTDGSRGIIECYIGTLQAGSETRITIDATPISLGQQAIITADYSSLTRDSNPADNHAEAAFITAIAPVAQTAQTPLAPSGGGSAPIEQTQTPVEEFPVEQEPTEETAEAGEENGSQETGQSPESDATGEQDIGETGEESTEGTVGDVEESSEDTGTGQAGGEVEDSGDTGGGDSGSDGGSTGDAASSDSEGTDSSADDSGGSNDGSSDGSSSDGSSSSGDSGSDGGSTGDAASSTGESTSGSEGGSSDSESTG